MIKRKAPYIIDEVSSEEMHWNEWVWQSHLWNETFSGYYICNYCKSNWTSTMGLSKNNAIFCLENPRIKKLLSKAEILIKVNYE